MNKGRSIATASNVLLALLLALAPTLLSAIEEPPTKDSPDRITTAEALVTGRILGFAVVLFSHRH
jgi:hypothetical protein